MCDVLSGLQPDRGPGANPAWHLRSSDDGAGAGGAGLAVVTSEEMFDDNGETFVFLGVEVGIFEEIEVAGAADAFDFAEDAERVETELVEFFAGGGWKHGRDYINSRARYNGTLVLRAVEIR